MPTLRCSLSKEVRGETGGRTAAVSLEVELAAETLKNPMLLKKHIRCGFDRVRAAIDEELGRPEKATAEETGSSLRLDPVAATAMTPIGRPRRTSSGC